MASVDPAATISGALPQIQSWGLSLISMVAWLIFIIIFVVIGGIFVWMYLDKKKYKYVIIVYEKVGSIVQDTRKDMACDYKIGDLGSYILFLKKAKKYLPMPSLQSGRRKFYYYIREDGEWINFQLKDLDMIQRKMDAHFLDKEMRYANTGIRKGLKDRYDVKSFWAQYGIMIMSIAFIAIIGIMTWLLFDKWIALAGVTNSGVENAGKVMEKANTIIGTLENICNGGSGIRAVNMTAKLFLSLI